MSQVRKRVALGHAPLVGDGFIAARKRHRLEAQERNLLGVVERKTHHGPDLLVIDTIYDRDNRYDVNARSPQVFDRPDLHVKQVANSTMRVSRIANAVELKVCVAQTSFRRLLTEIFALGELDAIGRSL